MPSIIFNYKVCDKADECGGIMACPNGAITYDRSLKRPVWHADKCNFCLKCTLPDTCPVGAIIYAADSDQEKIIQEALSSDPRPEDWLWQERYGVHPSTTSPLAVILTPDNYDSAFRQPGLVLIDVWHPDFIDCRLRSPLFTDLLSGVPSKTTIYKLNASKYPKLAQKLNITTYPSLLVYSGSRLHQVISGYIYGEDIGKINRLLHDL